ncbi:Hypothetical_protein [Hexamita inflata]|uniref:Hypothetical_protein n=1 Tax=Hexamita inflata TaxID=28002 RepID=A0ABP1I9V8_9EUKA
MQFLQINLRAYNVLLRYNAISVFLQALHYEVHIISVVFVHHKISVFFALLFALRNIFITTGRDHGYICAVVNEGINLIRLPGLKSCSVPCFTIVVQNSSSRSGGTTVLFLCPQRELSCFFFKVNNSFLNTCSQQWNYRCSEVVQVIIIQIVKTNEHLNI